MKNNKLPLSACILVKNAQKHIKECLENLQDFDEIILLDNESSDDTLKIAKEFNESYKNLKIYQSEFIGFGALKNLALSYATNEWIFSIDSDEVLEKECLDFLKDFFKSPPSKDIILALPRKNLYKNEWIKASGWYPDYVIRVFNKNYTKFNENIVHESVIVPKDAKIKRLDFGIRHYACSSIEDIVKKMNLYTSHSAKEKFKKGKKASISGAIFRFFFTFFKDYFFRKGIFYGYKGLVISLMNAQGAFLRYIKLYELNKDEKASHTS
ncbi:glycosyltransferase, family 2 [Campylobacter avium LMG 24591]|uniref:Glycosyltransferase, family 2 n=1 Tax=Campylobacter avium LMG 24591 TaxID=522484 RepID=A0A222MZS3_9BACT|nr:glycosyltransferase family 2 protein [Campylobacter avium]ASQ31321.1 glycosyltransferase, family 2 [Campylobacter avium LMG 24591]OYD79995.1 glycosyltransferase, family 2 [Campylobacter avium]